MTVKKIVLAVLIVASVILAVTFFANRSVDEESEKFVTSDIGAIHPVKSGLLLGTSRTLKSGAKNDFFYNRIDAAVALFDAGKIRYIIVSGDNGIADYNEPNDMKIELIRRGVADSVIYLDYAGFRTLDSVIRAKEVFGQDSIIVISQRFHNERAIYIARRNGVVAYGYNAKDVDEFKGFKTKLRELFARDKLFIDLAFGVNPRFIGAKVEIK